MVENLCYAVKPHLTGSVAAGCSRADVGEVDPNGQERGLATQHLFFVQKRLKELGLMPVAAVIPGERNAFEADIPNCWVVDEARHGIWTFSNPTDGRYAEERLFPEGGAVPLPGLDATFEIFGLFPPQADRPTA